MARPPAAALALVSAALAGTTTPEETGPSRAELLAALTALRELRDELAVWEPPLIAAARAAGVSWAELAPALGVSSRQAAERRFLRLQPSGTQDQRTGEERVRDERDRRAGDRAVAAWARHNSGTLRQLAGRISALQGLPAATQRRRRRRPGRARRRRRVDAAASARRGRLPPDRRPCRACRAGQERHRPARPGPAGHPQPASGRRRAESLTVLRQAWIDTRRAGAAEQKPRRTPTCGHDRGPTGGPGRSRRRGSPYRIARGMFVYDALYDWCSQQVAAQTASAPA